MSKVWCLAPSIIQNININIYLPALQTNDGAASDHVSLQGTSNSLKGIRTMNVHAKCWSLSLFCAKRDASIYCMYMCTPALAFEVVRGGRLTHWSMSQEMLMHKERGYLKDIPSPTLAPWFLFPCPVSPQSKCSRGKINFLLPDILLGFTCQLSECELDIPYQHFIHSMPYRDVL